MPLHTVLTDWTSTSGALVRMASAIDRHRILSVIPGLVILSALPFTLARAETFACWLALLFGWTQLGGQCGHAHLSTMNVLWHQGSVRWLRGVGAYTAAGLITSVGVGTIVANVGRLSGLEKNRASLVICGLLALALALREFGLLRFPIPEWRRQTVRTWAYNFGWTTACAMWGAHIGLGVLTVITYGGYWLLLAGVAVSASPTFGAVVMAGYWIGRVVGFWLVPVWHSRALPDFRISYFTYRPFHALGLVAAVLWLAAEAAR